MLKNRQNWIVAFRSALVLDSFVFAVKLAFAIWWIVETVWETERWSSRPVHDDMDHLHGIGQFFWFYTSISLMFFASLRWVANFCQYRNENVGRACCCCCSTGCWFVLGTFHLIYSGGIIATDWCTLTNETFRGCESPKKFGIGFLSWEILVFGFMAIYKTIK